MGRRVLTESSNVAFRAQLVIAEQRQLYDYWARAAAGRAMPARGDISPAHFPRLLPNVSLLERVGSRLKVRLAGTRLRDLYDREITGLYFDEIDWGDKQSYWQAVHEHIAATFRPAQGVVRAPRLDKDHLVQFWLRLPLSHGDSPAGMILCHDTFIAAQRLPRTLGVSEEAEEPLRLGLRA
jgi:hypothetical protein